MLLPKHAHPPKESTGVEFFCVLIAAHVVHNLCQIVSSLQRARIIRWERGLLGFQSYPKKPLYLRGAPC